MTDILNQIDATLAQAESAERNARRFSLAAGGDVYVGSTSACAMRWAPHGKSGIEEGSAAPEVMSAPARVPVATGDSSPEGRRQFVADVAAFRASIVAGGIGARPPRCPSCNRWMDAVGRYCEPCTAALSEPVTEDLGPVQRPSFTLADMEEASAAVRARRELPPWAGADTLHYTVTIENGAATVTRRDDGPPVDEHECGNCGAVDPSTCVFNHAQPVTYTVDVSADGTGALAVRDSEGHVHLTEAPPPVDELEEPEPVVEHITAGGRTFHRWNDADGTETICDCHLPACEHCRSKNGVQRGQGADRRMLCLGCRNFPTRNAMRRIAAQRRAEGLDPPLEPTPAPAPWWRRMLGGGTR